MRVWPLPYASMLLVTFALPVPNGAAVMVRLVPSGDQYVHRLELQEMTNFVTVGYAGTLAKWREFLDNPAMLPDALKTMSVDFAAGEHFHYDSHRVAFSVGQEVQAIGQDSILTLGTSYYDDHGQVVWDVGSIELKRTAHDNDWIFVSRQIQPSESLDDSYKSNWDKLVHQRHPYDAVMRNENDVAKITAVIAAPDNREPAYLYSLGIGVVGTSTQDAMKSKLDSVLRDFRVTEQ